MDDQADGIITSLVELLKAGLIGAALAIIILYLFLRQWSSTFIVVLSVPFSLLVTMAFMYFFHISLNILSMLGLLLAVGMLVDNAVVVTENIYRHQRLEPQSNETVIKAVKEVALAVTAGTATITIVFLPMIFGSQNEITIYLKHIAITLCVALIASLILAQTIVPLLASKLKTSTYSGQVSDSLPRKTLWVDTLILRYRKLLRWQMDHRKATLGLIFFVLATATIPVLLVKKDMFPPQQDRRLRLNYDINDTYTVAKVEETVTKVEKYLFANKDKFEIDSVYSYYEGNIAMTTILLKKGKDAHKTQQQIQDEIRKGLPDLAISKLSFERRRFGGSTDQLRLQLVGNSTEQLTEISRELAWTLNKILGFKDVRSEASVGKKEVHVVVDRDRAKLYGVTPQDIAGTIAVAMRGVNLRKMHDEDGEIDVKVEFQKADKRTLDQLQNIKIYRGAAEPIKLATLADFKVLQGPNTIHREDRVTAMGVSMDLEGMTVDQGREKLTDFMKSYNLPPGVAWNFGRTFDFEKETINTMLINTILALVLIYIVMASLFENLVFPAAIWTSIIFAVIGVWWFFLITGTIFDLMAWIGVLILIGVVVNNGIVLIDHINQLRLKGLSRTEAIIQGGGNRLRPILMTAGTTVLSLIPLSFTTVQIGGGGPPYYPMARAIVGGLAFSTLVTLIILPEIYLLLDDLNLWFRQIVQSARDSNLATNPQTK